MSKADAPPPTEPLDLSAIRERLGRFMAFNAAWLDAVPTGALRELLRDDVPKLLAEVERRRSTAQPTDRLRDALTLIADTRQWDIYAEASDAQHFADDLRTRIGAVLVRETGARPFKVVAACPRCHEHGDAGCTPKLGGFLCVTCGHEYTTPTYWQQVSATPTPRETGAAQPAQPEIGSVEHHLQRLEFLAKIYEHSDIQERIGMLRTTLAGDSGAAPHAAKEPTK